MFSIWRALMLLDFQTWKLVFCWACTDAFVYKTLTHALIIYGHINSMAAVLSKLNTQWSTSTPNDPKTTAGQKFLNTPKEPLARDCFPKFHRNLLKFVDEEAFWAYLNNAPKWPLDDLWPPNSWTPLLSPHLIIIVSKYHENPSRHIQEKA